MNVSLVVQNIINDILLKNSNLRGEIKLPHGFGASGDVSASFSRFNAWSKKKWPEAEVKILQFNAERRRVVAEVLGSDPQNKLIVKWMDKDAFRTFNYLQSLENEKKAHLENSIAHSNFVPRCFSSGPEYLLIESMAGTEFYDLLKTGANINAIEIISLICASLDAFYKEEKIGHASIQLANKQVMSAHRYSMHLKGPTGFVGFIHSVSAQRRLNKLYGEILGDVFNSLLGCESFITHKCIYDLDEHNIVVNPSCDQVSVVDWEDQGEGLISFDLSYFAVRAAVSLVAFDYTMGDAQRVVKICRSTLAALDVKQTPLFDALVSWRLLHIIINPWLWPSDSTWNLATEGFFQRKRKLGIIKKLFDISKSRCG